MKRAITLIAAIVLPLAPGWAMAEEMSDSSCYECHDELKQTFAKGTVHQPVLDGECDSCHADHGDAEKLMLVKEGGELCLECHDKFEGSSIHEPVADGSCLDCHLVHNSPNSSLLTADTTELCGECHSDMDHSAGKSPHEPVAEGQCGDCHLPHASSSKPLLAAAYSTERYLMYKDDAYALCFECHDKEPFSSKNPEGTDFRNGGVNLHSLHLIREEANKYGMKKQKEGMTCMGCHVSHGTEQPKLIRYNLECGETYCYTMNYRKFENGGTCVVGCHKPKVYKKSELAPQPPIPVEPQPLASKETADSPARP